MSLDNVVREIFESHQDALIKCIKDEIIMDVLDMVLENIYKKINEGKINLTGVLDKNEIYKECVDILESKGSK